MHLIQVATGPARPTSPAGAECPGPPPAGPRELFGDRLRKLRKDQFLTRGEVGETLRTTSAGIRALEEGQAACTPRDAADLLTIYGVTGEQEREGMLRLAGAAAAIGWWRAFGDAVPPWFETCIGLESAAGLIRTYEDQFVPGLLQTRDYAHAVVALGENSISSVRRRVALRMRRQQILHGARPPRLWCVIDEAVLSRSFGGRQVMRAQLQHLLAVSELPHITVQVLPFSNGEHPEADGPVTFLRLPGAHLPDIVYLEALHSGRYPEDAGEVDHYRRTMDRLVTTAAPVTETRRILQRILERT